MDDLTRTEAINKLTEMKTVAWTDHRQMKAIDIAVQEWQKVRIRNELRKWRIT